MKHTHISHSHNPNPDLKPVLTLTQNMSDTLSLQGKVMEGHSTFRMDQTKHIYINFIKKCCHKKLNVKQDTTVLNVCKLTLSSICQICFSCAGNSTIFEKLLPVT